MPGPIISSTLGNGLTASGNSVATTAKKNSGLSTSAGRRTASRSSRATTAVNVANGRNAGSRSAVRAAPAS